MLSEIRYQQQYQQLKFAQSIKTSDIVTYQSRDAATGLRVVQTADGGINLSVYASNSIPEVTITQFRNTAIGLPSYINQKSH